tara:strand:- start:457 stop:684 length:228 start_codon:yes stop_codon:yes gene_type:complete
MIKAVHGCHRNGIVHNDIKPENFKYRENRPDSSLMLIDFGIARRYRNSKRIKNNRDGKQKAKKTQTNFYLVHSYK